MSAETTLREAKAQLRDNFDKGSNCPCCGQFVKLYRRKLTSSMVYGLILINRAPIAYQAEGWLHVEDYLKTLSIPSSIRGDISKLKLWGFLESANADREDGSPRNGYYRMTVAGRYFIEGKSEAHSHVRIYNNSFRGFEGELINVKQALGNKFNYQELMEASQ